MTGGLPVVVSANNNNTVYVPNVVVSDGHLLQVSHGFIIANIPMHYHSLLQYLYYSSVPIFGSVLVSISEQ